MLDNLRWEWYRFTKDSSEPTIGFDQNQPGGFQNENAGVFWSDLQNSDKNFGQVFVYDNFAICEVLGSYKRRCSPGISVYTD